MIACGKASVIKHTRSSVWEAWGPPPSRQLEQKNRKPVLLSTHTPLPPSLGYWRHPRALVLPPRWGPKWGERWDKGPRGAQPPAQGGLSWYFLIHVPPRHGSHFLLLWHRRLAFCLPHPASERPSLSPSPLISWPWNWRGVFGGSYRDGLWLATQWDKQPGGGRVSPRPPQPAGGCAQWNPLVDVRGRVGPTGPQPHGSRPMQHPKCPSGYPHEASPRLLSTDGIQG